MNIESRNMHNIYSFVLFCLVGVMLCSCDGAGVSSSGTDSYVIVFETADGSDEDLSSAVRPVDKPSPKLSQETDSVRPDKIMPLSEADSAGVVNVDSLPTENNVRLRLNPIGGSLGRVFNDSNHVQLAVASEIGIKPIEKVSDIWKIDRPLRRIASCKEYYVDNLTHSLPYLVPEASDLLGEIGARFNDSLQVRGGGDYRIKVTSVLRTSAGISKLRRQNINAVKQSAHQYGTTFDISYAKFIDDSTKVKRSQEDLKNLLAEILKELSSEGRCFVKYERKQGCFHITARPVNS